MAAPAIGEGWRSDPLAVWLMTNSYRPNAEHDFFAEFCARLSAEGIDIARAFFPEGREASFVNGVLDHMAREAKPDAF